MARPMRVISTAAGFAALALAAGLASQGWSAPAAPAAPRGDRVGCRLGASM